jgi:PAS domain S-box-containing protein
VDLSIEDALSGESDTELIRVSGVLTDYTVAPDREVLNLRSGDTVFTADWDEEDQATRPRPLEKGSVISVTGICKVVISGRQRRTRSLRILLRQPSDVVLLEHPSWFTRQRLYQIALGLGALILVALTWVWLLRRRVNAQTEALRLRLLREAELEESYSNIFKNASDVIYTHDRRGHVLAMNRAGEKVFGFSAIELLTMNFSDLLAAGQRDRFEGWISTIEDGGESPCEFEFATKSGASKTLELSVHHVTQHGKTEFDGIARDVTERKQAQAALEQAKAAAEAATLAKTRFLANMSHEIRTPLNSIIGMADSLAQTELSGQQRDYVSLFQRSGENLLGLINSILDLSRVESGQIQLEKRPFSPRAMVQSVITLMSRQAAVKGLDLTTEISDAIPAQIVGDEERMRQVLMNLIGNSLKFTERGSVVLHVHSSEDLSQVKSSRVVLRFEVADTGIGIPADRIEAIFESFTQADASTTRKYGGTGLGLSIARGLVELMGGHMGVESEPGGGSRFVFAIPCETAPDAAAAVEPVKEVKGAMQELPPNWSAKILLAEDSEANRLVIAAYLQKLPIELDWAPNGIVAFEMSCRERYDLILMDIQMPEMDGYEATRRIRECEREYGTERTPILALTAHAFTEEAELCAQAGCDAMLTKPIRRKVLLRAIYEYAAVRGLAGKTPGY